MSSGQADLQEYGVDVSSSPSEDTTTPDGVSEVTRHPNPKLGFETTPTHQLADSTNRAREVDWVVYTGRYPYVFDALRLGFSIGHREDSSYQWVPDEVDLPVHFLDNYYENPNLDRFVDRVFKYEPDIAVLGDIYAETEVDKHLDAATEIWSSYPEMELMLVPKCEAVFDQIPSEFILGYPNGASDVQATDVVSRKRWRTTEHRLHILGGTPIQTLEEIKRLTEDWVTGEPPADIAGLDWNGFKRNAEQHGDYASASGGWNRDLRSSYIPKRDLMIYSLLNAKHFWVNHGVWPDAERTELASREQLLAARDTKLEPGVASRDEEVLAATPPFNVDRTADPLYRTDDTIVEIQEPTSPLTALFGHTKSWEPAGEPTSTGEYEAPQKHRVEPTCAGCGRNVFARGTRHVENQSQSPGEVEVISYEQKSDGDAYHVESVHQSGLDSLETDEDFSNVYVFCSSTCRTRVEGKSPNLLTQEGVSAHTVDGSRVGEVHGLVPST
jgi:hypothetical protein